MVSEQNAEVYMAALAGLLHDIGKFAQRAGVEGGKHAAIGVRLLEKREALEHLIPMGWQDDIGDAVAYHHGGDVHKPLTQAVRVADWLAASERFTGEHIQQKPEQTPLIPITARVSLDKSPDFQQIWGYPLGDLSERQGILFPEKDVTVSETDYLKIWQEYFLPKIQAFPGPIDSFVRMYGLLDLLLDTTAYMPSATPWEEEEMERTIPDVSLYNHLHLTAAIAACLIRLHPDDLAMLHGFGGRHVRETQNITVARLFKVDFSGIQAFIYRVTEPSGERGFRHTAKRLRGRSLYLALLNQAIGDWLMRRLALPPTNIIYAGGGVLEVLLPPDAPMEERLAQAMQVLEEGMWHAFQGDLGVVHAMVPMQPGDFKDVRQIRLDLEQSVSRAKGRKWSKRLQAEEFFEAQKLYHTCPVCGLSRVEKENQICDLCTLHKMIGQTLPYMSALAHMVEPPPNGNNVTIDLPSPMQGALVLARPEDEQALLHWSERQAQPLLFQGINTFPGPRTIWPSGSAPGQWVSANAAPVVNQQVYDFETMAALSRGAQLLGILRGDADWMGLNFSHGLHPPTFSRGAALSHTVTRFFGAYLNELARGLTREWRENLDDPMRDLLRARQISSKVYERLDSLFYILYAGGDDLFVVGPWDQMVTFALRLAQDFKRYTCGNLTLSAGLIFIKPHFPVQHFSRLAGEAEKRAKEAGRKRIHFFNRTVKWARAKALIDIARGWLNEEIPRGLIHDLGRMGRVYVNIQEEDKPLFTPRLYYTLTRRLQRWDEAKREAFIQQVIAILPDIVIPASYTSLMTRKE